jgi:hypothetical protein
LSQNTDGISRLKYFRYRDLTYKIRGGDNQAIF